MDVGTALAKAVFIPFFERRWGIYAPELLRELERSQYDDPGKHLERQLERFRKLVEHAMVTTPLYRQRYSGIDPRELRDPKDFAALPLLTKTDLREHGDELISDGHARETMFHTRTGGSTGVPVHVWWDDDMHSFTRAMTRRHDSWAGFSFGQKKAVLWGDTDKKYSWKERLYKTLCERTIHLDTLHADDAHLAAFVDRIREFRPEVLMGHAHSIYFFTRYLVDQRIDDIAFLGIIATAETLVPSERRFVEERFGAVLFDRYGCEEVSLIASECEAHDGLHISAEGMYVEVLDGDDDTPGRVVVTNLICHGMPLIRYEIGDLATTRSGDCACGRGLPRLGRVMGRTTDVLYTPEGGRVSGVSILDTYVIHVPGLRQAQIVQDRRDHLRIRVVRDPGFDAGSAARLGEMVREVFGPAMWHDLEYVEAIAPTPRGKYQFSICEIEPPSVGRS